MNSFISLQELGLTWFQDLVHDETTLSRAYKLDDKLIVIDKDEIFEKDFSYKRYCQKQNEWMKSFAKVYRILEEDVNSIGDLLADKDVDYDDRKTMNREDLVIDPTPLEHIFEECFMNAYGASALKYLVREHSIINNQGKTVYLDYALFKNNGNWIAIEENGISYHHPKIIGKNRYKSILAKQNSVVSSNGIVYRWDTESLQNRDKIIDELKEFIGPIHLYQNQEYISESRGFVLHEHQVDYLVQTKHDRRNNIQSALIVLPVGTGKTAVALEDIKVFSEENEGIKALITVPSLDLKLQWQREIEKMKYKNADIEVLTYSKASKNYKTDSKDLYDYIVVDEAHHAVAPVLKKVINHFQPKFLLGLTATDKRLDKRKLEDVFGSYKSNLTLKEAIQKGILCPIKAYRLETNIDLSNVRFNGKDYINSQLEREIRVPSRNEVIAQLLKEYFVDKLIGKPGIIFCVNIAHAKEMAKVLRNYGISADAVDGTDIRRFEKIEKYMAGEIQFLCTCSLLTEGWDAPHTSVIVMARPTLSQVLYTQQLGRGTRKSYGKESLYVIDVVDTYGSMGSLNNRPWSLHALFNKMEYMKFGDIVDVDCENKELVTLDTIYEKPIRLSPMDIYTFEKYYGDFLSTEEMARELFLSTGTVVSWIRKKEVEYDVELPLGKGKLYMFAPSRILEIRKIKGLIEHTEESIIEDFWSFIDQGDYTFSYKMYFILSLLECVDDTGDAYVIEVLNKYQNFYLERNTKGLVVDKSNSPYNSIEFIKDDKGMKESMLTNPFEKFERKRFMYYNKDLAKISIHHRIWEDFVENGGLLKLKDKMISDIDTYYKKI